MVSMRNLLLATLLIISLINVEICESGRILTDDALTAALSDPALADKIPADISGILPSIDPSTLQNIISSNNISNDDISNALAGMNGTSSTNISNADISNALAGMNGTSSNNISSSDISNILAGMNGTLPENATTNANANVPVNATTEMPTIPELPDLSALSGFSLPPMPSLPKMPKIPNNVTIMGVEVPLPKFLTSMSDDQN